MQQVINDFGETVEWDEYWKFRELFHSIGVPLNNLTLKQIKSLSSLYSSCGENIFPYWTLGNREWFGDQIAFFVTKQEDERAFDAYHDWEQSFEDEDDIDIDNMTPKPWEVYPQLLRDPKTWCFDNWPVEHNPVQSCVDSYQILDEFNKSLFRRQTRLVSEVKHRNAIESIYKETEQLRFELDVVNNTASEQDPWIWMNSFEENGLDSMSDGCIIKMSAGQLRNLLSRSHDDS